MPRPRFELLGPLYGAELARLSRQPALMMLKCVLVGTLLFLVFTLYPHDIDVQAVKQHSRFMDSMLLAVGGVQLAAIWLLTPWFAAAVLTEDREKKTLDLLLTTTLTDRDVVLGKLAARITFVAYVVLAGVPVFAILLTFGGISPGLIVLVYLGTLLNLVAIAGITVGCAALTSSYRATLALTWGIMFLGAFCPFFGPGWFVWTAFDQQASFSDVCCFGVINVVIAAIGITLAVKSVRPWETGEVIRPMRNPLPVANARGTLPIARPVGVPQRIIREESTKSVTRRPVGIKADLKWNSPPEGVTGPPVAMILPLLVLAAMGVGYLFGLSRRETDDAGWMASMSIFWVPVGIATCAGIAATLSREREADTIIMLLTVPASRTEILWRKVWNRLSAALPFWILTAFLGLVIIALVEYHRYWGLAFVAQGVAILIAAVGLGVFLSVYCASTFLAQAAAIMVMLFAGVSPQWSWLTSLDGHMLSFLPLHAGALVLAGVAGWFAALRSFENYCPK